MHPILWPWPSLWPWPQLHNNVLNSYFHKYFLIDIFFQPHMGIHFDERYAIASAFCTFIVSLNFDFNFLHHCNIIYLVWYILIQQFNWISIFHIYVSFGVDLTPIELCFSQFSIRIPDILNKPDMFIHIEQRYMQLHQVFFTLPFALTLTSIPIH